MKALNDFREIWLVDFEFSAPHGERPVVRCMVAREVKTGKVLRLWEDQLTSIASPPYGIDSDSLFVAYYASAEMACHLSLGWELPDYVLDLFVEFRSQTNGLTLPCGAGLLGALSWFDLDAISSVDKEVFRELAMRGGPYCASERVALLDYCQSDVDSLYELLTVMAPHLDVPRALHRGRYMKAVARIEHCGIPVDGMTLSKLRDCWDEIKLKLIERVDERFQVYDGQAFRVERFADFLNRENIPWPRLPSGALDLKDETFKAMAASYPVLNDLRELRQSLSQLKLSNIAVGTDVRNRCLLSAFRSRTGRNQPSNSKFLFGPSVWIRSLIKPEPTMGLAYIDWSQQEFGIAAALSNDSNMKEAYLSGDPYLAFAKQAGAVPGWGTKETHKAERDQFKACVLAVQYGMGYESLALRINQPTIRAKELLRLHKETYREFWAWSDAVVDYAMLNNKLWTVFGWAVRTGDNPNPRFLRNFLMQANGSEMLRLACCLLTENGIRVCAPVHDAVLIEAPISSIREVCLQAQALLEEASSAVLDGFRLRSDVDLICFPDRYMDERGARMWSRITEVLDQLEPSGEEGCINV